MTRDYIVVTLTSGSIQRNMMFVAVCLLMLAESSNAGYGNYGEGFGEGPVAESGSIIGRHLWGHAGGVVHHGRFLHHGGVGVLHHGVGRVIVGSPAVTHHVHHHQHHVLSAPVARTIVIRTNRHSHRHHETGSSSSSSGHHHHHHGKYYYKALKYKWKYGYGHKHHKHHKHHGHSGSHSG